MTVTNYIVNLVVEKQIWSFKVGPERNENIFRWRILHTHKKKKENILYMEHCTLSYQSQGSKRISSHNQHFLSYSMEQSPS